MAKDFTPEDWRKLIEERAQDVATSFIRRQRDRSLALAGAWKSPIEELLGCHLLLASYGFGDGEIEFRVPWTDQFLPRQGVVAGCQVPVGRYRPDFFFIVSCEGRKSFLVVECDGHEFHEKTKEQARHDKSRDRWFLANSIAVMRFTGSEIWADPERCAEEVGVQLAKLFGDLTDAIDGKAR